MVRFKSFYGSISEKDKYYDQETGLHYNYNRYYDPSTGRYLTPDPIGLEKTENNLFIYSKNNPIRFSDPSGLSVSLCKRQAWGDKYIFAHCYILVNGKVYSWHTTSHEGITSNENYKEHSCSEVKCCKEQQGAFDRCVETRAKSDIGYEGETWIPVIHDCCSWANSIIDFCKKNTCDKCDCDCDN